MRSQLLKTLVVAVSAVCASCASLATQASSPPALNAINAPNEFADVEGRRLAYRSIGSGIPIVLCTRFRGTMDDWDPAFLDALAAQGFRVITFDYTGLGLSTGVRAGYDFELMADDAHDLMAGLGIERAVIGGWSMGGLAAQVLVARHPNTVSHAVLIGTGPAGKLTRAGEPLFQATAMKPVNGFEDEVILFFEPSSDASREAARRSAARIASRAANRSKPVPADWAVKALRSLKLPGEDILDALKKTGVPILHIGGDHDISLPVENWYAVNRELPTVQLLTFPRSGHGPHHQFPEASAEHIGTFVRTSGAPR
jgi:pimeloyl-ACP methyl ester carboxylesterase